MHPKKLQVIEYWPIPTYLHKLRSFIGICSYYKRFIINFAEMASLLHALQKKTMPFRWGSKEIAAFDQLKQKLCSHLMIVLPDLHKPFVLEYDASWHSIGAVLMQDGKVVAYESRLLQNAKISLNVYKQKLLSMAHALTVWKHYLLGADFHVQTNH